MKEISVPLLHSFQQDFLGVNESVTMGKKSEFLKKSTPGIMVVDHEITIQIGLVNYRHKIEFNSTSAKEITQMIEIVV